MPNWFFPYTLRGYGYNLDVGKNVVHPTLSTGRKQIWEQSTQWLTQALFQITFQKHLNTVGIVTHMLRSDHN